MTTPSEWRIASFQTKNQFKGIDYTIDCWFNQKSIVVAATLDWTIQAHLTVQVDPATHCVGPV